MQLVLILSVSCSLCINSELQHALVNLVAWSGE